MIKGFDIPGEYWLLHHILPEAVMYVPSYLLLLNTKNDAHGALPINGESLFAVTAVGKEDRLLLIPR